MPWRTVCEANAEGVTGACPYADTHLLGNARALSPHMAEPVRGPRTLDSDEETPLVLVEQSRLRHRQGTKLKAATSSNTSAEEPGLLGVAKRRRTSTTHSPSADSEASTAAPAPSTPSAGSPVLSPASEPTAVFGPRSVDYCNLSVQELKEELGLQWSSIADDWSKGELVALLEELDRVCLPLLSPLEL
mmetsp:Transcript_90223/g.209952  ORF Transcript_90223/g.209952 Transcript_90223/m.209952 type:complete len:189 (+) Transcript_90223:93-659(+)